MGEMIGWEVRQPTGEECVLVGRDVGYAEPAPAGMPVLLAGGDVVIETSSDVGAQKLLAGALEMFGRCDAAHVIPAGVYLEE